MPRVDRLRVDHFKDDENKKKQWDVSDKLVDEEVLCFRLWWKRHEPVVESGRVAKLFHHLSMTDMNFLQLSLAFIAGGVPAPYSER